MITISNEDYRKAKRLLRALITNKSTELRDYENRRKALLLIRKWEKREKYAK